MTSSCSIYFRPIDPSDRNVIQELHEEWFPIRYQNPFYENIVENKSYDGSPLYTCVACAYRSNINDNHSSNSSKADIENPFTVEIDDIRIKNAWKQSWKELQFQKSVQNDKDRISFDGNDEAIERIVGCLIGRFIDNPSEENKRLLVSDPSRHNTLFYIMTLGVADGFRNCGLATELVQRCIHLAHQVTSCGAVYLHVITYNTVAIQFYEKLGFRRITEIKDYYNIDGTLYDCYLYALFIHDRNSPKRMRLIFITCQVFYKFILRQGRSLITLSIFQNIFYGKSKNQRQ